MPIFPKRFRFRAGGRRPEPTAMRWLTFWRNITAVESAPISPPAEVPTNGWISVTAAPENINRNAIGPGAGKRACRFRTTSPRVPGAAGSDLKMCCATRRPMPKASATGVSPPAWSAIQSGNSRIASANAAAAKSNPASSTATSSNSAATGSRKVTSPIRNCLLPAASIS